MWLLLNYVVWHYWHPIFYVQNPYRNHTVQKFDIRMHSYLCMLVHINFRIPSSASTPLSVSCTMLYVYTKGTYIWRWLTSEWVILIQFDYPVRRTLSEYVHTCIPCTYTYFMRNSGAASYNQSCWENGVWTSVWYMRTDSILHPFHNYGLIKS